MTEPYRYGFYLRPDLAMSSAQGHLHRVLRGQYGLVTAGLFPPHATLKGFFRSEAAVPEMVERLEATVKGWVPFTAHNGGLFRPDERSIAVSLRERPDGSLNEELYALQDRTWEALGPLVAPLCEFTPKDPRGRNGANPFHPHLTLAQDDLRPELQDEVFAFVDGGGPVGPAAFTVGTCHLYRFEADWAGDWTHSLRWELLHSVRAG